MKMFEGPTRMFPRAPLWLSTGPATINAKKDYPTIRYSAHVGNCLQVATWHSILRPNRCRHSYYWQL